MRLSRRAARAWEHTGGLRAEWQVEREIARVAHGRGPILAGPWLSEVGFEVLYWVPFLRWFENRYRIDATRVIAISRGGAAAWYEDVAARYVDIFDHVDPATYAARNADRRTRDEAGGQKQHAPGEFDRELLDAARRAAGVEDAAVMHPSLMYRLFRQFWLGNRAVDHVFRHVRHQRTTPSGPAIDGLPPRYVAAKFYTSAALTGEPAHREALRDLVAGIAAHVPVVVLDTGLAIDDHEDYSFRDIPNVTSLRAALDPRTNLGVQTAVIARAERFVGTCGSLAWLAPLLGVDTVAVYTDDKFLATHLYFARQAYRQCAAARFETLDLRASLAVGALAAPAGVAADRRVRS